MVVSLNGRNSTNVPNSAVVESKREHDLAQTLHPNMAAKIASDLKPKKELATLKNAKVKNCFSLLTTNFATQRKS